MGGGNTYALLKRLRESGLLSVIRERVMAGMPYLGASAGSNVAGPTILTTNDWNVWASIASEPLGSFLQHNPHTRIRIPPCPGEARRDLANRRVPRGNASRWPAEEGALVGVGHEYHGGAARQEQDLPQDRGPDWHQPGEGWTNGLKRRYKPWARCRRTRAHRGHRVFCRGACLSHGFPWHAPWMVEGTVFRAAGAPFG